MSCPNRTTGPLWAVASEPPAATAGWLAHALFAAASNPNHAPDRWRTAYGPQRQVRGALGSAS